jgi:hypothetical protein
MLRDLLSIASLLLTLALAGCGAEATGCAPWPGDVVVDVRANPANPFSALVELTADHDMDVHVEVVEHGEVVATTPVQRAVAGEPAAILVLGLRADRTHEMRPVGTAADRTWIGEQLTFETDRLPGGWPDCAVTSMDPDGSAGEDEVVCTNGWVYADPVYYCVDRTGEPVWALLHPDDETLLALRARADGGFGASLDSDSRIALFDRSGSLTAEYGPLWFEGRTRFEHTWIDMHELIDLSDGPWAGAVAFLTTTDEPLDDGRWMSGTGVIVFDPATEQVLWDWSAHGERGDGVPIDPALDYDRLGLGLVNDPEDWTHGNALVHVSDDAGGQQFWLSLRHQDWIVAVDPATDGMLWRLGHQGDFALVDDLDAGEPAARPDEDWYFRQHAPELRWTDGSRARLLVFDNGAVRPGPNGEPSEAAAYSRVVELEFDTDAMRAAITFDFGASDPGHEDHFYSEGMGDADMLWGGDRVQFVSGWGDSFVGEIGYPGGDWRWRLDCPGQPEIYRVNAFPDLYDTTWWYGVDR